MLPFPSYKLQNYSRALSRYMELYFNFKLTMIKGILAQSTRILWFVHFYIKLFVAEITFYLDKYNRCTADCWTKAVIINNSRRKPV